MITKFKIFETALQDSLLDQINKSGMDSLTDYEKDQLKGSSDNIHKSLDKNYSELTVFDETRNSFGRMEDFKLFYDEDMEMIMEYNVRTKRIAIDSNIITKLYNYFNLSEEEVDSAVKNFMYDRYDINVKSVTQLFKNVEKT